MRFDLGQLTPMKRYELLLGTILPRPIAIVTTMSADGLVNAAPYSLFSVFSHDPPIVGFSVLPNPNGGMKDTGRNVLAAGEFVLNLVSEDIAAAMNLSCVDAPPNVSEIELAGLETVPSVNVAPPRLKASPVTIECRFLTSLSFGPNQLILFGRAEHVHVPDELVVDAANGIVDTPRLKLIGAMHAAKFYARTGDLLEMVRPTWAEWERERSSRA
jgi:flavin reductase (DIM6/NTAB) family NADH-FMN oxidoreductase RutF